jgi:hypothetical protein
VLRNIPYHEERICCQCWGTYLIMRNVYVASVEEHTIMRNVYVASVEEHTLSWGMYLLLVLRRWLTGTRTSLICLNLPVGWLKETHHYLFEICDHVYVPVVVSTSLSFPCPWLITGFVTRVTRRVSLVEQGLLSLTKRGHLRKPPVLVGLCCSIFSFLCSVL